MADRLEKIGTKDNLVLEVTSIKSILRIAKRSQISVNMEISRDKRQAS
jgi:hypothetical protein